MPRIERNRVSIENSKAGTCEFLYGFNTYEVLMPDQINNWEPAEDECTFSIKCIARSDMRIDDRGCMTHLVFVINLIRCFR